jgi:hypothetical protein
MVGPLPPGKSEIRIVYPEVFLDRFAVDSDLAENVIVLER